MAEEDLGERCPNQWRCRIGCACHRLSPEDLEADLGAHYRVLAEIRHVPVRGQGAILAPEGAGRPVRDGCVFCDYAGPSPIIESYGGVFVIEPLIPVVPGHELVIPYEHVRDATTDPALTGRVMELAAFRAAMHPASNIITSVGAVATQSVFHLHLHVLPRLPRDRVRLPWDW